MSSFHCSSHFTCLETPELQTSHINIVQKKAQQRLYFLRQFRKFNLPQDLLITFYTAIIQSVPRTFITVWFWLGHQTGQEQNPIIETDPLPIQDLYRSMVQVHQVSTRKRSSNFSADCCHFAHLLFKLLHSGRSHMYTFKPRPSNTEIISSQRLFL